MTVNVRQYVPKTPITRHLRLLMGSALRKFNNVRPYLMSAISAHVISLHVCLSVKPLLAGRKAMVLWQVALLRAKAVFVSSEWYGRRHSREGGHLFLLITPEYGLSD